MRETRCDAARTNRRFHFLIGILITVCCAAAAPQEPPNSQAIIGASYSDLLPEQKALVDDWFRRFSEVVKKPVAVEEGYDNLPVSTKTTFSAVTHALIHTKLTDKSSGAALGPSAIVLIDRLDTVAGKIEGTGGDKQFRIYVVLKADALTLLAKSREFGRGPDNVVFHKGFPINYRSVSGTPSLQVSSDKEGKRADIDVDYRSSKFPAALLNGHLTASNSDVRAGDNDARHNQSWAGLSSWWRGFFGLQLADSRAQNEDWPLSDPAIKDKAKPEVAVRDFLNSWLVEQKPERAAPYFAEAAFRCPELEGGPAMDLGMVKFSLLLGMKKVSERIGKATQLSDVVEGVRLTAPRARPVAQPYEAEFMLYDVREDLAEQMKCLNRIDVSNMPEKAGKSKSFGKYFGSVFKLKVPGQHTETIATLWAKQDGYWKLISYDLEPEFQAYRVPDTRVAPAVTPAVVYTAVDKALVRDVDDFLKKWFVKGQPSEAFGYLAPSAYVCSNLYREDNAPQPASSVEAGRIVQAGMERILSVAGQVKKLEQTIEAPVVSHPDVKLVKHPDPKAYVLVSVPDHMAAAVNCQGRKPGEEIYIPEPAEGKVYGNYYASGFQLARHVGDPTVLWLLWTKESERWRIVSYFLITP